MSVQSASAIYSNAFNFNDFMAGGVDPRTGLYTCSLSLGEIRSEALNGPSFPIRLQFNPLNRVDSGFGVGWSLSLSRYDFPSRTLSFASGENYKARTSPGELVFEEERLQVFNISNMTSRGFDVVSKNGQREVLEVVNNTQVAAPKRIMAANGSYLSLRHLPINGQAMLVEVKDSNGRALLKVDRVGGKVIFTHYPGTECEAIFTLTLTNNEYLSTITLPTGGAWGLGYVKIRNVRYLSKVVSPQGAVETIRYKEHGHRFPPLAPMDYSPFVDVHVVSPGYGQPDIEKNYAYSTKNYLGYEGVSGWNNEGDNLYRVQDNYQYSSTEYLYLNGRIHSTVVCTYNKFHLLLSRVSTCGQKVISELTEYPLIPDKGIQDQPAQFRLPKTQTIRYEDKLTRSRREEVTETDFDVSGNLLKQVEPSGVTTVSEYYPARGADGCPADPLGFVRFVKQTTMTPAAGFAAAAPTIHCYRYGLQAGVNGATVANIVPIREQLYEGTISTANLRSQRDMTYFIEPATGFRHGQLKLDTITRNGKATQTEYHYSLAGTTLSVEQTLIGFDGTRATMKQTRSALNGLKLSMEDDDQPPVVFKYDAIGRLLSESVAAGTVNAAVRTYDYALPGDKVLQATLTTTDVMGQKQRVSYDGLGRTISIEEQDSARQANGPLRQVYAAKHDALGRVAEETRTDWLLDKATALKTTFIYDDWGQVKTALHQDGRKEHSDIDPVALRETRWLEGAGKTVTVHNLFGKPDSVERFDLKNVSMGKTTQAYDGLGRCVRETDPVGNLTRYEYDVFDRLCRSTLPDGNNIDTTYSSHSDESLPSEVKVAGRSLGQQTYDGLGRLTESKVGGRVTTFQFDGGMSQPAVQLTPGKDRIMFGYERSLGNQIVSRNAIGLAARYTYDPKLGLLKSCNEGTKESTFEYYPSGRLKSEERNPGGVKRTSSYTYSLAGRPDTYTDILGDIHETVYDHYGRPTTFKQKALTASFAYNPLGQLATVTAREPASKRTLTTHLTYDDLGREVSRAFAVSGGSTQILTSSYTKASKLATRVLKQGVTTLRGETFTYDARGRLIDYQCTGTQRPRDPYGKEIIQQLYQFDALDNIVSLETRFPGGSNIATYTYSSSDATQLIGIRHTHKDYPAPVTLGYDANGQLIKDEQGRALSYDPLGRLTQVALGVGTVVRGYHYDARDRLVELSQPGSATTERYYRGARVANELRGSDKTTCLRQDGLLLGEQQQGQQGATRLFGTDQQQSVLREFSASPPKDIAYSPYGHRPAEGGLFSLSGFNGEQLDPLTGLYLLGNGYRAYSPALMRFHCPDSMSPFGAGGLNPYAYCLGDPINRVDPTGHFSWQSILGIVAAVVGVALSVVTLGAATPLAIAGVAFGVASGVTGIAGIIAQELAPDSQAGAILGWVSLGLGVASLGAGLSAFAARKLSSAITSSGKLVKENGKIGFLAGGKNQGGAFGGKAGGKGAKAAAKGAKGADAPPKPTKWTLVEEVGSNDFIPEGKPGNVARSKYAEFKSAVESGDSPRNAAGAGGSKGGAGYDPYPNYKSANAYRLEGKPDLVGRHTHFRIGGADRVFLMEFADELTVVVKQVGRHDPVW
ncbi:RHS repeat domain-containing protein [Pseudomonas sp. B28(2017)]|uniref:RHS repeat domain-containing protein n=1 Tax=Pseudomonas sp. B28(2017) TaxID=1981730 RepID=UPI000A1F3663|nr:RHS repeat-associated core domain-containing protein [Pseudomonas sp. B28(2017)]